MLTTNLLVSSKRVTGILEGFEAATEEEEDEEIGDESGDGSSASYSSQDSRHPLPKSYTKDKQEKAKERKRMKVFREPPAQQAPTSKPKPKPSPEPVKEKPKPKPKEEEKKEEEKEVPKKRGFVGYNPRDKKDDYGYVDYSKTLEEAYDNISKMTGKGGVKNLTKTTEKLMNQQKELMDNMKDMAPVMANAGKMLDGLNISGLTDMIGKLGNLTGQQ